MPIPALGVVLGALALFLVVQEMSALRVPFLMDDYIFLDKARKSSLLSVFGFEHLTLGWYRPWSRELHFWLLYRLFGAQPLPYHVVSFVLWLAVMAGFFTLVRRVADTRVAILATAGAAALEPWAVTLTWVAGAQDLWMLLFALLAIHAVARGRAWAGAGALVLALLSKETAAVVPALALAWCLAIERLSLRATLARNAPLWIVTLAWATIHPILGGRWWRPVELPSFPGLHPPLSTVATRTVLSPFNLEGWPDPSAGWPAALLVALPGMAILCFLAGWGTRPGAAPGSAARGVQPSPGSRGRAAMFGGAWALIGWTPLLLPTIGWHAYYALLGLLGAWLALACGLIARPALAVVLIAGMTFLRAARADTPSQDWGTVWFQRRAASFIEFMRDDLMRLRPKPPPHARMFFTSVPSHVGFMTDDGPALRIWYRDATVSGGFYRDYRPRGPSDRSGEDYFFRYDSTSGWVEVMSGAENLARARGSNPRWEQDHLELAAAMARAEDWAGTSFQYEKLAAVAPANADYALNAGVCYEMLGDSLNAARWYRRAASTPGVTQEAKQFAEDFELRFRSLR